MQLLRRINLDLGDREFYRTMLAIALPVTIQQLISSLLNMLDVLMVGQLGDASIAALGLSNQVFFLLTLLLFGLTSGAAVFTTQYWGQRDVANIRRVLGISLSIGLVAAGIFTIAAFFFPTKVLGLYTNDKEVIAIGARYLQIVSLTYIMLAVSGAFQSTLRSVQLVRLPMIVSLVALTFKTGLGYILIFGKFGLPKMGVEGAAYSTLAARLIEVTLVLMLSYGLRTPAAARLRELFNFNLPFLGRVLRTTMPAVYNEIIWSFGVTSYNAIYAHIGTDAIAAVNVNGTVENLAFVTYIGIGTACAIMVGNSIGAGDQERAFRLGRIFLALGVVVSLFTALIVLIFTPHLIGLYQISPTTAAYSRQLLIIYAFTIWLRSTNFMLFIGILRAGGDTRYALFVEACTMWLVGVPLAALGGLVFHLPVPFVYGLILVEELVKFIIVFPRYQSRRWIHDLVSATS